MTLTENIIKQLVQLPEQKQQEVLRFVELLASIPQSENSHPSARGQWSDLAIDLSEAEIDSARQELWGAFPREAS